MAKSRRTMKYLVGWLPALLIVLMLVAMGSLVPVSANSNGLPHLEVDKDIVPASLQVGEQATVTLTISGAGEPAQERLPLDVMLIIDRSGSMGEEQRLVDAQAAAIAFIDILIDNPADDRVGLVSFSGSANLDIGLTADFDAVKDEIDVLSASAYTNIGAAISEANNELETNGRSYAVRVEILLSDGVPNRPGTGMAQTPEGVAYAEEGAVAAAGLGIKIYTIGLGTPGAYPGDPYGFNEVLLQFIASTTGGQYYYAPSGDDLQAIFEEVAQELITLAGTDVTVTEVLPDGIHYVDVSATPPPDSVSPDTPSAGQTTLIWNLGTMSIDDEEEITFDITADCCGHQLADDPATRVEYVDYQGESQTAYFPETWVDVTGEPYRVELIHPSGSNQVGTEHVLTATVYDECDNAVPDQDVGWEIVSGPGDFVGTPDPTSDANGQAQATIISDTVGTTTVRCSVSQDIYDEATKEWTAGEPYRVELLPDSASNQVGTDHVLTATVYDQYDNVVPGQDVEWAIVGGPGEFVEIPDGATNANGEAHATISSNTVGTTTVKASVSEDIYDEATKEWFIGGVGGRGGGGGGGGGPVCTETFVVDFLGEITRGPMQPNGRLCEDLEAPCPDAMHLLEMRKDTRTVDSEGGVVRRIEITEATAPSLPLDTVLVGSAYEFSPSGITFDRSISLTLSYPVGELPADTLSVAMAYYSEGSGWTVLEAESSQVAEIGSLTSLIDHFSIFAIIAEVPPPELTVADLVVFPEEVSSGEDVTISVLVANTGGSMGSVSVVLRVEGEVEDTVEVILTPGASETITFSVTRDEAGTYGVMVNGLSGSFTVTEAPFPWWAVVLGAGLGALLLAAGVSYVWVWRPRLMAA